MNKQAGVWIDHRKAVVVAYPDGKEAIEQIPSDIEKHVRQPAGHARSTDNGPEDQRDRAFMGRLNQYYDKVIARIGDASSILIMGPGEAKEELKKRLENKPPHDHTIVLEPSDKMDDREIAAKVRGYFAQARCDSQKRKVL